MFYQEFERKCQNPSRMAEVKAWFSCQTIGDFTVLPANIPDNAVDFPDLSPTIPGDRRCRVNSLLGKICKCQETVLKMSKILDRLRFSRHFTTIRNW